MLKVVMFLAVLFLVNVYARVQLPRKYNKYELKYNGMEFNGAEIAYRILQNKGIHDVEVQRIAGHLTDHYDSSSKTIYLSESVHDSCSLSAITVAAHEVGHAIQDNESHLLFKLQQLLSYLVSFSSTFTRFFIYFGFIFNQRKLLIVGFAMLFGTTLFQVLTLPVERDASKKAISQLTRYNYISNEMTDDAKKILSAAGFTYIYTIFYTIFNTLRLFPK